MIRESSAEVDKRVTVANKESV